MIFVKKARTQAEIMFIYIAKSDIYQQELLSRNDVRLLSQKYYH